MTWPAPPRDPHAHDPPGQDALGQDAPVDLRQLREVYADSPAGERRMIGLFLTHTRGLLDELAATVPAADGTAWRALAHKLKGGAGVLGAQTLLALAHEGQLLTDDAGPAARQVVLARLELALALVSAWLAGEYPDLTPVAETDG